VHCIPALIIAHLLFRIGQALREIYFLPVEALLLLARLFVVLAAFFFVDVTEVFLAAPRAVLADAARRVVLVFETDLVEASSAVAISAPACLRVARRGAAPF
jgi:hypothetical protein